MTNHLMRGHSSPTGLTVWMHLGESSEYFVPIAGTQESFHWERFLLAHLSCGRKNRPARMQITWAAVLVRWDPVEGKVVCQDWALVRQDKAVLPAATPVAVAAEWLGRASECLVVLNPERR